MVMFMFSPELVECKPVNYFTPVYGCGVDMVTGPLIDEHQTLHLVLDKLIRLCLSCWIRQQSNFLSLLSVF